MTSWLNDSIVALVKESPRYAATPPYHPSESYPEWPDRAASTEDNPAFRGVHQVFMHLGLDRTRAGTAGWNPLGDLIEPGNVVVIKPNLVTHANLGARAFGLTDTDSLITHGSVIRAVADYAAKALAGRGTILIGDCPLQGTDWQLVLRLAGLHEIRSHLLGSFPGVDVRLGDYRLVKAKTSRGRITDRVETPTSGDEYADVDLGADSLLMPLIQPGTSFGVSQYPRWRMCAAHTPSRNSYVIAKDLLVPDVFLNIPKLKVHQKAGMTCALKNLVGINGHKDCLPHFRFGSPKDGGDEYPDGNWLWDVLWACWHREWERDRGAVKRAFRSLALGCAGVLRLSGGPRHQTWLGGGSWHGNDTIWRTVLDLNRLFFYFDRKSGALADRPRTDIRYLAIADGLIGGEGEGPLAPSPVACGWMLGATNPAALDAVATACMGFDAAKIPLIREAFGLGARRLAEFLPADIHIRGNTSAENIADLYLKRLFTPFNPSQGFKGAIEFDRSTAREHATERAVETLA